MAHQNGAKQAICGEAWSRRLLGLLALLTAGLMPDRDGTRPAGERGPSNRAGAAHRD
jgi:hypothetical protein